MTRMFVRRGLLAPRRRWLWWKGIALAIFLSASDLPAADRAAGSENEQAIQLGRDALNDFEEGRYRLALDKFTKADALFHSPVFLLYQARCLRALGDWLEAEARYARVVEEPLPETAPDVHHDAVVQAREEGNGLRREIPTLVLLAEGSFAADLLVFEVDGTVLIASTPHRLNPGLHRIVASDGAQTQVRSVELAGAEHATVTFAFTEPVPPVPERSEASLETRATSASSVPAWSALILSGAGTVTLGVAGVWAISEARGARRACPESLDCSARIDRADTLQIVAQVGAGVAVVGGVAAFVLWPSESVEQPSVSLGIGPRGVWVGGRL